MVEVQRAYRCASCLLGGLVALTGCSAYDPERIAQRDEGGVEAGAGSGASGAGGDAAPSDGMDAALDAAQDAAPPDAQPSDATADAPMMDSGAADADAEPGEAGSDDAACGTVDAAEDCCPDDPNKTAPGQCGCGVLDADADSDGTADCNDSCPMDGAKTAPGTCGCGRADVDMGATASCTGLRDALLHRYRFDGSGSTVVDARGDQDGDAINVTLAGTGSLVLAGGTSDQYVNLPNDILSNRVDATIEVWLSWGGGADWERIFDFGNNNNATEGNQGTAGTSYLFLTPRAASSGRMRVAYSVSGSGSETRVEAAAALATGGMHHVAVVANDTGNQLLLYVDGALANMASWSGTLAGITDINNWLGRSQYSSDAELGATLYEVRIYGAALRTEQVALSFADGPDPAYME